MASRPTGDVTAVVLTLGEPTTRRALAALGAQTLPFEECVVVEGVAPFHRALNSGAASVTTPYFVQVDADMILEPECCAVLRRTMAPEVGIAVGALRDPLIGPLAGVKMYRRECFREMQLRDTAAPEIDFWLELRERGWQTLCVPGKPVGAHRPAYEPDYVFGTYFLLGARYAQREDVRALTWRFGQLRRSRHAMAPVARLAMSHGMFATATRDVAKPRPSAADSRFLRELAASDDRYLASVRIDRLLALEPPALFGAFSELGVSLRATSHACLRGCLRRLAEVDHDRSLLAEIALGHGALAGPPGSSGT